MEKQNMVNLAIDNTIVEPIIRAQIQAAIVQNMGNPEELISKMVALALRKKVNSDGKVDQYDSYNKYDFIEAIAARAIQKTAQEVFEDWVEANKDKIKVAVEKELRKPSRNFQIAKALADSVATSLKCLWSIKCDTKIIPYVEKD
jgi:hypothetical protein